VNAEPSQNGVIGWFVQNSVAANLLMFALLIGGLIMIGRTSSETLPEIDPRMITVSVEYPGATPSDVEDSITKRVEDAVMGLAGVDRVTSVASEGIGTINVELDDFSNAQSVKEDVQGAVDRLQDFPPQDANEPRVTIAKTVSSVVRLIVTGNVGERELKEAAEGLKRDLLGTEGVSIVTLQGARDYEISIEISEDTLRQYNLSLEQVAAAIRASSANLSLGTVRTSGGDILLRSDNEARDADAFANIIVLSGSDGQRVRLGDISVIRDGFVEAPFVNKFNGLPAVFLQIDRSSDEDAFDVKAAVGTFLETHDAPSGIEIILTGDDTQVISDRINLLVRNAIMGLALVFVFLALTLDMRLAFWTTVGIPVAFLGGFIVFGQFVTINMITLLGLIMVLGIVVDDAIVVGENIYDEQAKHGSSTRTAILGARGVFVPVLIGVSTTMIAFGTLINSAGILGQLLQPLPIVVMSVLFISLIEVFAILPNHLAHGGDWSTGAMLRLKKAVERGLFGMRDWIFMPIVTFSVRFPFVILATSAAILIASAGLVTGGHLRFIFFPVVEGDEVTVSLEMPAGTPFEQTEATMQRIINAAYEAVGGKDSDLYQSISVTTGGRLTSGFASQGTEIKAEAGFVTLELAPAEHRSLTSAQIEGLWRDAVGQVAGIESLTFESAGLSGGDDISFSLSHPIDATLSDASKVLATALGNIEGVAEIETSAKPGKRQIAFTLSDGGIAAGLTVDDLARNIRRAYFGEEVQRFQRGTNEVEVFLRFPAEDRQSLADLARLRIPLPGGGEVPLTSVAKVEESRSFVSIDRVDGQRVITISADVDEAITTPTEVNALIQENILPQLKADFTGLKISTEGQSRSQAEEIRSLFQNFLIAILGIYVLIACVLRSYIQPIIILAIIPFGLVGAVLGHVLLGYDMTFLSLFGVVALAGVIINDSIVLIDYFNILEKQGGDRLNNIVEAVRRRFRPIFLTTMTTFIGLIPMISETSLQAQFLIPMAVSLAFGILFASFLILFLVPACLAMGAEGEAS
jgi:multidrug efflux pump subunit AcrB